jgi:hypothetical protein
MNEAALEIKDASPVKGYLNPQSVGKAAPDFTPTFF